MNNGINLELFKPIRDEFKNKNGSYICRELIGEQEASRNPMPAERTSEYYKKRPCVMLVGDAAEILEECLKAEQ